MPAHTEQQETALPGTETRPPLGPRPRSKKAHTLPRLDHCLNCGTATGLQDNFCPNCGQENENETVPIKSLVADVLSELASWDSKLVRTLLLLLFRPGHLTNEYNAGRRVRYLSPLKMYLVISALFFLTLPSDSLTSHTHVNPTAVLKSAQSEGRADGDEIVVINREPVDLTKLPKTVGAYEVQQERLRPALRDPFFKRLMMRQVIKAHENKQSFAQSVAQRLLGDLPKMMFFLLPLFAVLLKLTYWRRKRLYVEHLIFALHGHAFTFALLTLAVLLSKTESMGTVVWIGFFVLVPVYLSAAMRRVYRQGWGKTLFKFAWLGFNYFLLLSFAFVLTLGAAFLFA